MRISDWSSDVCSSDLFGARRGRIDEIVEPVRIAGKAEVEAIGLELERGFGATVRFALQIRVAELEALRRDVRAVRQQFLGRRRTHRARDREAELAAFEDVIGRTDCAREAVEITFETERAEERRVGKEWVRTWKTRGS